jgi:hypothetical protein
VRVFGARGDKIVSRNTEREKSWRRKKINQGGLAILFENCHDI